MANNNDDIIKNISSGASELSYSALFGKTSSEEDNSNKEEQGNNTGEKTDAPKDKQDIPDDVNPGYLKALITKINSMRNELQSIIYGQDNAINVFLEGYFQAEVLDAADQKRVKPKATFLFSGPPGVGKTYLAENIARLLELPYMRFDMSEYSDREANLNFSGSNKVYKNGRPGVVTEFVKKNPKSVLLFDEVEKAHLNTIYLFLQMLDAGRLKDSFLDEEISFKDTIIILTTNAGKQLYENSETYDLSGISRRVILDSLRKDINPNTGAPFFPAAICSRFAGGNVIMFNHMEAHNLISIVQKELCKVTEVFEKQYGISFDFEENVFRTLLFAEGGNTDARTIKGRAEAFIKNEILELVRLICSESNDGDIEKVKKVKFLVDLEDSSYDVKKLFENTVDNEVLILAENVSKEQIEKYATGNNVTVTSSCAEAVELLKRKEISMAIIDFSCKKSDKPYMNVEDIDSEGRKLFWYIDEYHKDMPRFILETDEFSLSYEEKVTFAKLGARGILKYSAGDVQGFVDDVYTYCARSYQNKKIIDLAKSNQVITYKTAQTISEDSENAKVYLFDFKRERAVESEDSNQIVSDVSKPDKRFSDVIGAEDAKKELQYFVNYLKNPNKIAGMGARPPRGVLLYGPPGTGKTMLAKAMAGEADVTYMSASGSEFLKSFVGEGAEAIRRLFRVARKYAPTVIFIDEIDAIGKSRTEVSSGAANEDVMNALLTEMDGFNTNPGKPVFVLAATNFAVESGRGQRTLDPALVRRFDRKIYVDVPNKKERAQFIKMINDNANNVLALSEDKIDNIAMRSTGMSLAELENVIELSYRNAVRMDSSIVSDEIFDEAFESFNSGEEKKWSEESIMRTARHEAGHAFMCKHGGETPTYLTIVARDNHGGYMLHADNEDKGIYTKEDLINRIRVSLGGRAAEIVYYNEDGYSSGASGDLENATNIARLMLCNYGMDSDFGLATINNGDVETEAEIRKRINEILKRELEYSISVIRNNAEKFEKLVDALIENNHLNDKQIEEILD